MEEQYSDDVRKKLKAVKAKLKEYITKRQKTVRERMYLKQLAIRLETDGPAPSSMSHLENVRRTIVDKDQKIWGYDERILEGRNVLSYVSDLLESAPRRPRSPESSIAASGAKAMGETAQRSSTQDEKMALHAWEAGIMAAAKTAKCDVQGLPLQSVELLERRWSELYPDLRLTIRQGSYHVSHAIVKRSLRRI